MKNGSELPARQTFPELVPAGRAAACLPAGVATTTHPRLRPSLSLQLVSIPRQQVSLITEKGDSLLTDSLRAGLLNFG